MSDPYAPFESLRFERPAERVLRARGCRYCILRHLDASRPAAGFKKGNKDALQTANG